MSMYLCCTAASLQKDPETGIITLKTCHNNALWLQNGHVSHVRKGNHSAPIDSYTFFTIALLIARILLCLCAAQNAYLDVIQYFLQVFTAIADYWSCFSKFTAVFSSIISAKPCNVWHKICPARPVLGRSTLSLQPCYVCYHQVVTQPLFTVIALFLSWLKLHLEI